MIVLQKIKKGSYIFYQNATSRWVLQVASGGNDQLFLLFYFSSGRVGGAFDSSHIGSALPVSKHK